MSDTEQTRANVNNGPAVDEACAKDGPDPRNSGGDPNLPGGMELAGGPGEDGPPPYYNVFRDGSGVPTENAQTGEKAADVEQRPAPQPQPQAAAPEPAAPEPRPAEEAAPPAAPRSEF